MKIMAFVVFLSALVALSAAQLFAEGNTRIVQAEFDRCSAMTERVERSLRRYEDAVNGLKRAPAQTSSDQSESMARDIAALENRLEYFRNRFERSQGQADKIRDDLKNVSGPTCPSCIESSVNLYCRSGESLQTDIDEYCAKAADLQAKTGPQNAGGSRGPDSGNDFAARRADVGSAYDAVRVKVDACADHAAATLAGQAHITLVRADSLRTAGDTDAAEKALGIAASLLEKSVKRCGAGK
jgi:hypothetical protein